MDKIRLRGSTADEKVESLAGIVTDMKRTLIAKQIPVMPSLVPISASVENAIKGDMLLRYFFPVAGVLKNLGSVIEGARIVTFSVNAKTQDSERSHRVTVGDGWRTTDTDIEIAANSLITVFLDDLEVRKDITEVSVTISLLFQIAPGSGVLMKVGREQLGVAL